MQSFRIIKLANKTITFLDTPERQPNGNRGEPCTPDALASACEQLEQAFTGADAHTPPVYDTLMFATDKELSRMDSVVTVLAYLAASNIDFTVKHPATVEMIDMQTYYLWKWNVEYHYHLLTNKNPNETQVNMRDDAGSVDAEFPPQKRRKLNHDLNPPRSTDDASRLKFLEALTKGMKANTTFNAERMQATINLLYSRIRALELGQQDLLYKLLLSQTPMQLQPPIPMLFQLQPPMGVPMPIRQEPSMSEQPQQQVQSRSSHDNFVTLAPIQTEPYTTTTTTTTTAAANTTTTSTETYRLGPDNPNSIFHVQNGSGSPPDLSKKSGFGYVKKKQPRR